MTLPADDPVAKALAFAKSVEESRGGALESAPAGDGDSFAKLMSLLDAAADALNASPDADHLGAWLELRARTSGLELEGVDDAFLGILATHPDAVSEALDRLGFAERARALLAIREIEGLEMEPGVLRDARIAQDDAHRSAGLEAAGSAPALEFLGDGSLGVAQGRKTVTGVLTVTAADGSKSQFKAHTGGWGGRTFHERGGPLPPGTYKVNSRGTPTGHLVHGMTSPDGAASFYFHLEPDANTIVRLPTGGTRDGLCIHPDGDPAGTLGCIGLAESGANDNKCRDLIAALMHAASPVRLAARYEPGVLDTLTS